MKRLIILCLLFFVFCPLLRANYINKPLPGSLMNHVHPLGDPIACWFADGSNSAWDYSGNHNTGTFEGDTHNEPGRNGYAWSFDGNGDFIDCGANSSITELDKATISLWVNVNLFDVGGSSSIFSFSSADADSFYLIPYDAGVTNRFIVLDNIGGIGDSVNGNTGKSTGIWYYIVVINDGTNIFLYINNILEKSETHNTKISDIAGSVSFKIARIAHKDSQYFTGSIDDVKLYNRALSEEEIKQLYITPFCMFEDE